MEETVPVVANAVRHLVGKGGGAARLIKDITGIIVGWAIRVRVRRTLRCLDWDNVSMPPGRLYKLWQGGPGPFLSV